MKLKNTSSFTDEFAKYALAFCRPSAVKNFDVGLKKSGGTFYGRAYCYGSRGFGGHGSRPFIVLRIGKIKFPFIIKHKKGKGYFSEVKIYSYSEMLIFLTAHELRHLWQRYIPKGRRIWGARGQFSERDADAYALQCLRRFRRENNFQAAVING